MTFDTIIIGGGAAGLYCAMHAGQRGRRVLVLEHNAEVGAKILISGGGRCNFTNLGVAPDRFLATNPHFARSALARHTQHDFIAMVRKHGIDFYEKTLGQLFCEGPRSSQKIVRMLLDECAAGGVDVRTECAVSSVKLSERFTVETSAGAFDSETLVIATGGLSIPKLGATPFAYRVAEQFGIPLVAPRAGLVPLTFNEQDMTWMRALSGVSTDVRVSIGKTAFREAALFTHKGLSGPAILQISSYWATPTTYLEVDWLPDASEDVLVAAKRVQPNALPKTALSHVLPERLATVLCAAHPPRPLGEWKDEALITFAQRTLKRALLKPHGTEGYAKAEVTVGGIDTNALSQQTMETRAVPGLFFIGEAVDVTGWLGGYNFQWAWSSGWAAGQAC
ncbi:BaiN/RdsA family NAD(P)/FAD-dependent oxidoreductase [Terricaulis silvestris]|uniref:Anaerobic glycerol-3-phosphate dehydrogenase subunit B n=1 Tax=Terricaulis silvestris TaxID=2686094 RepID=A0A6I6MQ29_9CAUL|nr:NAD(P)/FAD-dependent oxidoreductase [Terricaulis silvestris]QGZ95496.1 anaerobic glycerol-3-phosphate dehydrogenase subunit B [Terricaulis silvestris]